MNREDIIRMAREAGIANSWDLNWQDKIIEAFAKLVAQHEREKFCAVLRQVHDSYSLVSDSNAIRARGQA